MGQQVPALYASEPWKTPHSAAAATAEQAQLRKCSGKEAGDAGDWEAQEVSMPATPDSLESPTWTESP